MCVGGGHPSGADQPPLGQSHLTAWNWEFLDNFQNPCTIFYCYLQCCFIFLHFEFRTSSFYFCHGCRRKLNFNSPREKKTTESRVQQTWLPGPACSLGALDGSFKFSEPQFPNFKMGKIIFFKKSVFFFFFAIYLSYYNRLRFMEKLLRQHCSHIDYRNPVSPIIASYIIWSLCHNSVQFSSVQSLSHVQLFATPWIAACQASLSITNSRSWTDIGAILLIIIHICFRFL